MKSYGALPRGTKLDKYVIQELIGSGNIGEVYRALHEFLEKEFALKVVIGRFEPGSPPDRSARMARRLREEAKVLSGISHPNVVAIQNAGMDALGSPEPNGAQRIAAWIATELLHGRTLRDVLVAVPSLDPATTIALGHQICAGVGAAHAIGVAHRDLKPDNLFIVDEPPGLLKVLDLGIAKYFNTAYEGATRTTTLKMGTPAYMSPEQIDGIVDLRTDIFAAGHILFECVAGQHAFSNGPKTSALPGLRRLGEMQQREMPPPLRSLAPHAPRKLEAIVAKALEKDPERRQQSMAELALELEDVQRDCLHGRVMASISTKKPIAKPQHERPPAVETPPPARANSWASDDDTDPAPPPSSTSSGPGLAPREAQLGTEPLASDSVPAAPPHQTAPPHEVALANHGRSPAADARGAGHADTRGLGQGSSPVRTLESRAQPNPVPFATEVRTGTPSARTGTPSARRSGASRLDRMRAHPRYRLAIRATLFGAALGCVLGGIALVARAWIAKAAPQPAIVESATAMAPPPPVSPTPPAPMPMPSAPTSADVAGKSARSEPSVPRAPASRSEPEASAGKSPETAALRSAPSRGAPSDPHPRSTESPRAEAAAAKPTSPAQPTARPKATIDPSEPLF